MAFKMKGFSPFSKQEIPPQGLKSDYAKTERGKLEIKINNLLAENNGETNENIKSLQAKFESLRNKK